MSVVAERVAGAAVRPVLADYRPTAGGFDEMVEPSGALRPPWWKLLNALSDIGPVELARRWGEARRLIHENGLTYNVYGDPRGLERPWALDTLPLLISPEQWRTLEAGLIQRALVLEAVLADLYGPQRLITDGLLPPELVYAHPGFLRPLHGVGLPGNRYLHLYAADLGRGPDGQFRVLGDRTQAPSGAGYALENRIVVSRTLPDVFRDCQVQRLAPYFNRVRQMLAGLAPRHRDNPRIVLLTPGPYNETYFEHAYLARYLGYTLVEGADLTVRDHRVFLKTLGGLQPIDVIFRRLDDDFCDPLELRGDSFLGVPGLVEAVRTGNVAVANPLGSGLLETAAVMPFLPGLCRRLRGEDLLLPSVQTWWCGDATHRQHVLANLPTMVVKPIIPALGRDPWFGATLSAAQRRDLEQRIAARPYGYVAQEQVALSTAPVWGDGQPSARHMVLRSYLVASDGGYAVMPGGLTRVSAAPDSLVVSLQKGGGSKDTWVLSETPVSPFSLLRPAGAPLELSRGGGDLPSRVADNLFWLGRYVQRADGQARVLRGIMSRLTEQTGLGDVPEMPPLLAALTGQVEPGSEPGGRQAWSEAALSAAIFDEQRPDSLIATLQSVLRIARIVRDRLSNDTWRVFSSLDLRGPGGDAPHLASGPSDELLAPLDPALTPGELLGLLNQVILTLASFSGLAMESMTRGQGWRFLDMGRRVEQAIHTVGLLSTMAVQAGPHETAVLEALLEVADSSMTYRRRYLSSVQAAAAVDLLLADESNPRSLAFQVAALAEHVEHLPRSSATPRLAIEQRLVISVLSRIRLADVEQLCTADPDGWRQGLDDLLAQLVEDLPALSDALSRDYLAHAVASRQLASVRTGEPAGQPRRESL